MKNAKTLRAGSRSITVGESSADARIRIARLIDGKPLGPSVVICCLKSVYPGIKVNGVFAGLPLA